MAPSVDSGARQAVSRVTASRALDLLALVAACVGVYLLFHDLAWGGSTQDEVMDFRIAHDFALHGSILTNANDPSQGRLPHMLGAASLLLFGESLWSFKLPFAVSVLVGGALLFGFVARRFGPAIALHSVAFYLTNPWAIGSGRSAATAGDALVIPTTFAFLWLAIRVWEARSTGSRSVLDAIALGLMAGVSVGAKLTNFVLFPAGLLVVVFARRSFACLVAFAAFASLAAVASHPLLATRTDELVTAVRRIVDKAPTTSDPARRVVVLEMPTRLGVVPVSLAPLPKLRYLGYALVGKLTAPFLLVVVFGVVLGVRAALRSRRFDPAFWLPLAFVLAPCAIVFVDVKQNVNYFLPLLLPAITIAALALACCFRVRHPLGRVLGSLGWVGIVLYQIWLGANLSPDFIQAGRRLGPEAQSKMDGPAVNQCQGTPQLIERLNQLHRDGQAFDTAWVFAGCFPNVSHDAAYGPIRPQGYKFLLYYPFGVYTLPHVLVVSETIQYDRYGMPEHLNLVRSLEKAIPGCDLVNADSPDDRFKIYNCPRREWLDDMSPERILGK